MDVMHERVAGLDVHKETIVACVRIMAGGKATRQCRTFETTTAGLEASLSWLAESDCTHVAMEATGVYWKPVWNILSEGEFELMVANAAHIKNVPGRKTDMNDAMWIADIQELRSLLRYPQAADARAGPTCPADAEDVGRGQHPIAPKTDVSQPALAVDSIGFCTACYRVFSVLSVHSALAQEFHEWLNTGPTADLVTQNVFDQVFRTYFLMYSVMRVLGNPLQSQACGGRIIEPFDPRSFETARFMPVTRSPSTGQRQILQLWNPYLDGTIASRRPPVSSGAGRA